MKFKVQNCQRILWILAAAIIYIGGCDKKAPPEIEESPPAAKSSGGNVSAEPVAATNAAATMPWRASLNDIIKHRRQWDPVLTQWYDKEMPDFAFTDIEGKGHKLSDYRGKNVVIVLWATYCPACNQEMPHIIAMQNIVDRDNLPIKILAVSNENSSTIKRFVSLKNINYTVLSGFDNRLPELISSVDLIPTSFFIDPEGKIKLVKRGPSHLGELKMILLAE